MEDSNVYKKNMGVMLAKTDDIYRVITFGSVIYNTNELGARIIDLCDGKNSLKAIAEKISNKFNIDYLSVFKDVKEFIKELLYLDILVSIE